MDKNGLIEEFNQSCIGLAAFMDDQIQQEFPDGEMIITEAFPNTQMNNIDDVWWDEGNIVGARNYYDALSVQARSVLTKMGEDMIEQHPKQKKQFDFIKKRTGFRDLIYSTPHMVIYSSDIFKTNGFETLSTICEELGLVALQPWLVTNPQTDKLNSAFMLAVRMQSIDNVPLRDKILKQADAGLFESVRQHYGLT